MCLILTSFYHLSTLWISAKHRYLNRLITDDINPQTNRYTVIRDSGCKYVNVGYNLSINHIVVCTMSLVKIGSMTLMSLTNTINPKT